ncbi:FAD-dependent oxidoreductase [Marinobacter sp. CHS3-4]|uniref:NAD(P)/FAD-dependent oxidoreductase n=1 Tax=Marinobacter sp. CHS3-4 TaxID=3045174 RepID=UPI0024B4E33A|nr:FAD-dependent oxidoreductase [Marinobacter sp. CHS3-4]MDI9245441.1 FAD-dependent oxidoreductase [Marinobacter sp. CHS3-4]
MINQTQLPSDVRSVAVIGSGMAGLCAGILLKEKGCEVTVFEKSRGPGGRLASKRVEGGSADIGAQYFTVRSPGFSQFLERYAGTDTYQPWQGRFGYQKGENHWEAFPEEDRYVGVPRMTAISRALSAHVDVLAQTRIHSFNRSTDSNRWSLVTTEGENHGPYDAVIVTAPPAQTMELLANSNLPALAAEMEKPVQHVQPCWAVAAHFAESPFAHYDGMRPMSEILSWVANNSSKPGRDDVGQWWVLHGAPEWSHANEQTPADEVARQMVSEFRAITGTELEPDGLVPHRWLYAKSSATETPGYRWFDDERIGLAGDWLDGGRVEGAFNSASSLIEALSR